MSHKSASFPQESLLRSHTKQPSHKPVLVRTPLKAFALDLELGQALLQIFSPVDQKMQALQILFFLVNFIAHIVSIIHIVFVDVMAIAGDSSMGMSVRVGVWVMVILLTIVRVLRFGLAAMVPVVSSHVSVVVTMPMAGDTAM